MASMNAKNIMLSPIAVDLGLGQALQTQLSDQEDQRKRKLGQSASALDLLAQPFAQGGLSSELLGRF